MLDEVCLVVNLGLGGFMKRTWLILLSALLISACSESSSPTGGAGGSTGLSYPLLDCDPLVPEFCGYPFPSNVYTKEDSGTVTGRRVSFGDEFLRNNDSQPWDYSDGFSAGTPILTYLPGASGDELAGSADIDQSLSASSPSILLDAERGEPVPHFAEIDARSTTPEQRSTIIRPAVRLRDNARYIVAFRNLTNDDDEVIQASPGFAALRDETPSEDESIEARRGLYEDIFEKLEAKGWARGDIQIAWDFNTASDANNTQWLLHMRDMAFQLIEDDGGFQYEITSVEPDPNADIAFRILGTFKVPLFMDSPMEGSLLLLDDNDMPMVNAQTPWADIPFELRIPKSASAEKPAAIIEYGHGLFGSAGQIGAGHFQTFMYEYNYAFVATDLQGMSSPDEGAVTAALLSGKFSNTQTLWDRLHQGFLNHLVLLRMMKTAFVNDATYGQYIKGNEAYYYGISQGGIMGSVVLGTSSDIERGALGVPGMPYSLLLFRSVDFDIFLTAIRLFYPDYRMNQLLIGMAQMLWDRVEPTGYAHHVSENLLPGVSEAKEVLMRDVLGDFQVTNLGAHILARTLNAAHVDSGLQEAGIRDNPWGLTTVKSTASGNFLMEYDFALPGPEPLCNVPMSLCRDPHGELRKREAARKQLDEFLRNGTGTNHCAPGDGDEYQVIAEGVCSYPALARCDQDDTPEYIETPEDTQALCIPQ
jgi:hypothetical protein